VLVKLDIYVFIIPTTVYVQYFYLTSIKMSALC